MGKDIRKQKHWRYGKQFLTRLPKQWDYRTSLMWRNTYTHWIKDKVIHRRDYRCNCEYCVNNRTYSSRRGKIAADQQIEQYNKGLW